MDNRGSYNQGSTVLASSVLGTPNSDHSAHDEESLSAVKYLSMITTNSSHRTDSEQGNNS